MKDQAKHILVKICGTAAASLYLACACMGMDVSAAHMGGDPIEVTVPDSGSGTGLTCVNYTTMDEKYTILMNGVPESCQADLLQKIQENLSTAQSGTPVKLVNAGFVDADKYSISYTPESDGGDGYDSGQCWLASTSDMLTIGGWSQGLYDPLNNYAGNSVFLPQNFTNEDDLFLYFTSNFEYFAGDQASGITFFCDGIFRRYYYRGTTLTKSATAFKNSVGTEQEGFYRDIYAPGILQEYTFTDNLDALPVLLGFGQYSYGVNLDFDNNSGHAVTAVGIVIDNEKTGSEQYAAILLADSDNEEAADIDAAPASMQSAYEIRKNRPNAYTMYGLAADKRTDGADAMLIKGYTTSNTSDRVFLGGVTLLPFKSAEVMSSSVETAANATKDAKNTPDYLSDGISVWDANYNMVQTIKQGEDLQILYRIVNARDFFTMTRGNAGADQITNSIEIIRNGELYKTIEDGVVLDTSQPEAYNDWYGFSGFLSLSQLGIRLPEGNYTVRLCVNTGNAPEAYVLNNTPAEYSFTVTAADSAQTPDPTSDPTPDSTPDPAVDSAPAPDLSSIPAAAFDSTAPDTSSASPLTSPKTGDSRPLLPWVTAWTALLAASIAAAIASKRKVAPSQK